MVEKEITVVPTRIWAEGKPPRLRVWEAEFNVASWIRVSGASGDLVLSVKYLDEAGEHMALVDRTSVEGDGSALMSGLVRLRFTGDVKMVSVVLKHSDAAMRYQVDELYFQRKGSALAPEDKLISNF